MAISSFPIRTRCSWGGRKRTTSGSWPAFGSRGARSVGVQVDVTDEAARLAVRNWVSFLPATASAESLIPMGRKKKAGP